ncbi:TetR/AcrR family transcriptional regulator [Flavihumibacter petaseus]|uniref:Putative TetR family transcriptional regulator n=1 Tax=Flavihumibacter petaseus NBRC 106054 TaxID=1220578 RepID=A0A0E9N0L4_9BACT|nr:TetR/AcrR family transcriptional regulator [Flavihumibacter petaseus]GAO43328.1 putative TetR family transcriptional regulator [Flavihumibacter petaseus NBRC 106054]
MLELKVKIEKEACSLFSRFGIKSITMAELAGKMGISKKTIYSCFQNKQELVDAVYTPQLKEAKAACLASIATAEDAIEECLLCWISLRPVITFFRQKAFSDIQREFYPLSARYQQFRNVFLRQMIEKNIERGHSEGLYRPSIHPAIIASLQTILIEAMSGEIPLSGKWSEDTVDEQILLHYLNGLVTARGAALLEQYEQQYLITPQA